MHYKKRFLLLLLLLLITASCTPSPPAPPTPTKQTFTVVPVYKDMHDYIEAAQQSEDPDLQELMDLHVIQPHWEDCAGREYIPPPGSIFDQPIENLEALEKSIQRIEDSNIEHVIRQALIKSAQYLDGPSTTVCVIAADPENWFIRKEMHGVNGWTFGSGKIILQIYPTSGWRSWVPYVIAHEYHHSTWTSQFYRANQREKLMDRLIFEGKADSFAHLVYPQVRAPWTNALSEKEERKQWERISAQRDSTDSLLKSNYMVGDNEGTPTWTGYTIGYHIVQSYLETHPDVSIQAWTELSPEELLAQSGYPDEY